MVRSDADKMDFIKMEKRWLTYWYEQGVVNRYLKKNQHQPKTFSYLDGPITANNPMGVHHAWGRTYKDLFPRFFNLLGYRQRFQNGFDCQGLWVEVEVEKELKLRSKKEIENLVVGDKKASIAKFVELCKQRVYKFSKIQTEQSKRLGYFADWDHSYYTMSDEYNYMIWHFLKRCYENGWIYKGRESVPWCPRCETAISQHEMLTEDYKKITHKSIIMELPVVGRKDEYLLVWTTTPWTIPANIAVAVDEKLDYCLVQGQTGDKFWILKELIEPVFKGAYQAVLKTVKGKKLVGLRYKTAFDHLPVVKETADNNPDNFHIVIATDDKIMPISKTEGTGLVHTAVSAGTEDFKLGKKLGLPIIPVIADNADYLLGLGEFSGKNAKNNPELILDHIKKQNLAFAIFNYRHRYPACWRCKQELVWKVEDEWYIAMDVPSKNPQSKATGLKKTLRQRMIEVAKKIRWLPGFGLERELDWLKNMDDWLISKKNRYWGLALPIYECKQCGQFEVIGSKEELRQRAVEGWQAFSHHSPHKPFIDEVKINCSHCHQLVSRINDVGNPWLDAGIVAYSTITENNQGKPLYLKDRKKWRQWFPADLISESFPGQFKNWFYALIAMSTVLEYEPPTKTIMGYGTLLGEDGRPMHKSWGNAIEFNEGADKIGVDVMRWMYCRQEIEENMLFGYKKADEVRRLFYLILWNSYRFFNDYMRLDQYQTHVKKFLKKKVPLKEKVRLLITNQSFYSVLDQWIINRFIELINFIKDNLLLFQVKPAALAIEKFVDDFSTWYIRRSRDRVWVNSNDNKDKLQFYLTGAFILNNLVIVLSPFLPFITEEIFTQLTGQPSVHLQFWPDLGKKINNQLINDMQLVRLLAEVGRRVRKEKKIKLRQPLAGVKIQLPTGKKFLSTKNIDSYKQLLADELNVKKVEFAISPDSDQPKVAFDTRLSPALIFEGKLRELIREIQTERKKLGLSPDQPIDLVLPAQYKPAETQIKKKIVARHISYNDQLKVIL